MAKPKSKEIKVFSFSRLETYNKCSELYRLQYIEKINTIDTSSVETEIGNRCHDALEKYYLDKSVSSPYQALLDQWKQELADSGLDMLYTDLNHIASDISKLTHRASANYNGKDAIRTRDGGVPRSPEMTTEWKSAVRDLKLSERQAKVDRLAAQVTNKWAMLSISDVFATSCSILYGYKNPKDISEILRVELSISEIKYAAADPADPTKQLLSDTGSPVETVKARGALRPWIDPKTKAAKVLSIENKVTFPTLTPDGKDFVRDKNSKEIEYPDDNTLFNGFIDLVCRTPDGKLAIVDHKSSKGEAPSVSKVARHQQLLMYGWAIWRRTGVVPDYIGINHLRTNKLVLAPFSLDMALEAIKSKLQIVKGIEKEVFIKQDPFGYGSMCVTDSSRGPRYCPFFTICHPDLVHLLEH